MLPLSLPHLRPWRAALYCTACAAAATPKIRLHTDAPLCHAAILDLPDKQRHYLTSVMRVKPGDSVALFNGADGEWSASVDRLDKRQGVLRVEVLLRPQPADAAAAPLLAFGLIKNARLPALIEKATELGAAELQPVLTQHCQRLGGLNLPRLQAIATEAAEQALRLAPTCSTISPDLLHTTDLPCLLRGRAAGSTCLRCASRCRCPPFSTAGSRGGRCGLKGPSARFDHSAHPPAWCFPGLKAFLRMPERHLSRLEGGRGLSSSPQPAPKMRTSSTLNQ